MHQSLCSSQCTLNVDMTQGKKTKVMGPRHVHLCMFPRHVLALPSFIMVGRRRSYLIQDVSHPFQRTGTLIYNTITQKYYHTFTGIASSQNATWLKVGIEFHISTYYTQMVNGPVSHSCVQAPDWKQCVQFCIYINAYFNPLNAELNPICHLLALLGTHHFLHVSSIRVKSLTLRLLMSYIYIYMECLFLMFLDHTQRRSTVGRTPLDE